MLLIAVGTYFSSVGMGDCSEPSRWMLTGSRLNLNLGLLDGLLLDVIGFGNLQQNLRIFRGWCLRTLVNVLKKLYSTFSTWWGFFLYYFF